MFLKVLLYTTKSAFADFAIKCYNTTNDATLTFQVIFDENVNVTPTFHTFDASKIKVGPMPQAAFVGTPVEFDSKFFKG